MLLYYLFMSYYVKRLREIQSGQINETMKLRSRKERIKWETPARSEEQTNQGIEYELPREEKEMGEWNQLELNKV